MGRAKKNYRKRRKIERNKLVIRKLRKANKRYVNEKGYIRYENLKDNSKGIDPVGIYPCDRTAGKD